MLIRRNWRRILALLATALFVLAGCGGAAHAPRASTSAVSAHSSTFGLPPAGVPVPRSVAAPASTIEMFDSVTLSAIPSYAKVVAGYLLPSSWPTYGNGSLARAFPHAIRVPIAVQSWVIVRGVRMACLDVEPGDAVPPQVVGWVRAELAAHVKPCVYSNLSEWAQIRNYLAIAGIPRNDYFKWLAYWVFHPGLTPGYDAQQWSDRALNRNLDENSVTLAFAGAASKPSPSKPQITKWTRARNESRGAYVARSCPTFAQRMTWFGHRLHGPRAARHQRALTASRTAYQQRGCVVYAQRVGYFQRRLTHG